MLKVGEVYENPVTGERGVIRIGTDTTGGELLVVDLYVRPIHIEPKRHPIVKKITVGTVAVLVG